MASHQTEQNGGRAPNYASLLTRGHSGEGTRPGWGTDSGCWLLPATQTGEQRLWVICREEACVRELWATCQPTQCHGMPWWVGIAGLPPTTPSRNGWQGKPTGPPVVSCNSLWIRRAGWWESDECTKPWGWRQGSLLQLEQQKVGCPG